MTTGMTCVVLGLGVGVGLLMSRVEEEPAGVEREEAEEGGEDASEDGGRCSLQAWRWSLLEALRRPEAEFVGDMEKARLSGGWRYEDEERAPANDATGRRGESRRANVDEGEASIQRRCRSLNEALSLYIGWERAPKTERGEMRRERDARAGGRRWRAEAKLKFGVRGERDWPRSPPCPQPSGLESRVLCHLRGHPPFFRESKSL